VREVAAAEGAVGVGIVAGGGVDHTFGMTLTTIKVDSAVRDRLKEQARARGRTLGEHLEALVEAESRRERLRAVRDAMAARPPDQEYLSEAEAWTGAGWT